MIVITAILAALAAAIAAPGAISAVRACASRLHQSRLATVERRLPESFLFVDSRGYAITLVVVVLGVATLATIGLHSGLVGSVAGGLTLLLPAVVTRSLRQRRRRQLLHQLPDCLDLLAASLRSGLGLLPAMQHLVTHQRPPLSQELGLVIRKQRLGTPLESALEDMHRSIGGHEIALFVTAVIVVRQLGGNLSEILARLGQTMRDRQAIEDKIIALTSQGRLQARIVGLLPLALLVVMTRMDPAATHLMYTTIQGRASLLVLAVLEVVGLLLLRRIARIDV